MDTPSQTRPVAPPKLCHHTPPPLPVPPLPPPSRAILCSRSTARPATRDRISIKNVIGAKVPRPAAATSPIGGTKCAQTAICGAPFAAPPSRSRKVPVGTVPTAGLPTRVSPAEAAGPTLPRPRSGLSHGRGASRTPSATSASRNACASGAAARWRSAPSAARATKIDPVFRSACLPWVTARIALRTARPDVGLSRLSANSASNAYGCGCEMWTGQHVASFPRPCCRRRSATRGGACGRPPSCCCSAWTPV